MKVLFFQFLDTTDFASKHEVMTKTAIINDIAEPEFFAEMIALFKKHSRPDDQDF